MSTAGNSNLLGILQKLSGKVKLKGLYLGSNFLFKFNLTGYATGLFSVFPIKVGMLMRSSNYTINHKMITPNCGKHWITRKEGASHQRRRTCIMSTLMGLFCAHITYVARVTLKEARILGMYLGKAIYIIQSQLQPWQKRYRPL